NARRANRTSGGHRAGGSDRFDGHNGAAMSAQTLSLSRGATVSRSRRVKNRLFLVALWVSGGLALLPLLFISAYVVVKGMASLNIDFFTQPPVPPPETGGGFGPAFVGAGMMVGIACLISIPLGLLSAVYLSEYGRGKVAASVRFVSEILLSTPSIIAGAFIWAL